MDFVSDLHVKAARDRAWLIGDPAWMRQWLLDQARRSTSNALEFKSGYAARCRDMALRYRSAPDVKVGNPHWEEQPRIPAGNSILSGRWTQLAGDVPGSGHNQGPPLNDLPELPDKRPETSKERRKALNDATNIKKRIGLGGLLPLLGSWLKGELATIEAASDPPDTLENLQALASKPGPGYHIHHIVEQTPGEKQGDPDELINGPDNLVRIPILIHRDISDRYSTLDPSLGNKTPREYLRGKSWEERREFGLKTLRDFGVLKQ